MDIENKYHLNQLDPPEIENPDAIASEVVADVVPQVEQAVEPTGVDQSAPSVESTANKKRGRTQKVVEQVEGEIAVKKKPSRKAKTVEKADGDANGG